MMDEGFKERLVTNFREHFGEDLVAMVLFGSRARGSPRPARDYDIFLIRRNLPQRPLARLRHVRRAIAGKFDERIAIPPRTPEEFEGGFPSLYLDLALDGIVLYDRENYITQKLAGIRAIINEAGLRRVLREGEFAWEWERPPKGHWEITWEGYCELQR